MALSQRYKALPTVFSMLVQRGLVPCRIHCGSPMRECIQSQQITPMRNCPFGHPLLQACKQYYHSDSAANDSSSSSNSGTDVMGQFSVLQSRLPERCIACGCGDNTIGHWVRWCVIPLTVVLVILCLPNSDLCLSDMAVLSPRHNAVCSITLAAFRRLLLLPGQDAPQLCYIGEDTPKMLLLVNAARPQAPETFVVEATAFPSAMRFGELLVACQRAWPYSQVPADPEFHVELRDGQAILNIGGYHCQQEGCLTCFLTNCAQLPQCPCTLLRIPTKTGCPQVSPTSSAPKTQARPLLSLLVNSRKDLQMASYKCFTFVPMNNSVT